MSRNKILRLKYDTIRRNITGVLEAGDFMPYIQELKKFKKLQKRFKIDSKWESQEEKIRYYMSISPKKKLEWLQEMHDFLRKALTKKEKRVYYRLRETR